MTFSVFPKPPSTPSSLPGPDRESKYKSSHASGDDVDLQDLLPPPTEQDFRTRPDLESKDGLPRLRDIASKTVPTSELAPPGPLPSRFPEPLFPDNKAEPQPAELPLRENDPDVKAALQHYSTVPERIFDPDDVRTWQGLPDTQLRMLLHSTGRRGGGVELTSRAQARQFADDIPTFAGCISACDELLAARRADLAQGLTADQVEASMRSDESMQTLMLYSTIGHQTGLFDGLPDDAACRRHLIDLVNACTATRPGGYDIQSGFELHDLIELGASRDRWRETKSSVVHSFLGTLGATTSMAAFSEYEFPTPYNGALVGVIPPLALTLLKGIIQRDFPSIPAHMSLDTKTGLLRTLAKTALSSAGSLAVLRCVSLITGGGFSGIALFGGVRLAGQLATDYLSEYGGSKVEGRLKPAPRWLKKTPSPSEVVMFNELRGAQSRSICSTRDDALKSVAAILASLPTSFLWAAQHGYASRWTPETVVLAELVRALPDLYWHAKGKDQA